MPEHKQSFKTEETMYQRGLWTLAAAWMLAVAAGFLAILKYGSTPGHAGTPAVHWPRETHVLPDPDRANLVLVVHPQCPCTRASIDSLARIMTRCQGELSAHVLCYRPAGFPRDWEKTDLWHNAAIIPGVQVLSDEDGAEAERFGAEASGHALLYGLGGACSSAEASR